MELKKETALVETILFLGSEPVTEKAISTISQLSIEVVQKCIENLKEKYNDEATGIELAMITGGWTLVPKTVYWEQLKERYGEKNSGKLSKSAIETLSIIAYSQPVTRGEIESIRGVSADNMIRLLLDRNLIKEVGRKDVPGRPIQFGTTKEFLKFLITAVNCPMTLKVPASILQGPRPLPKARLSAAADRLPRAEWINFRPDFLTSDLPQ